MFLEKSNSPLIGYNPFKEPTFESFLKMCSKTSNNIIHPHYQFVEGRLCRFIGAIPIKPFKFAADNTLPENKSGRIHQTLKDTLEIVRAIFGRYAIFKINEEFHQIMLADIELEKSAAFLKTLRELKKRTSPSDLHQQRTLEKLQKIANAYQDVFFKIRRKANISIALLVTMAASAVIAIVSCIFQAWAIAGGSLWGILIAGAILGCKWMIDSADKGHRESAKIIGRTLKELQLACV